MNPEDTSPERDTCSRCGACCRWLPIILIKQCKPHQVRYFRARGLRESGGMFLADSPCRHLRESPPDGTGVPKWGCAIYDTRPETCRDFCGKTLSEGKRFWVPEECTMAGRTDRK